MAVVAVVVVVVSAFGIGSPGGDVDNCTAEPFGVFGIEIDGCDGGSKGAGVLGSVGIKMLLLGGIVVTVDGGIKLARVANEVSRSGGELDCSGRGKGGDGVGGCDCSICGVIVIVGAEVDIISPLSGSSAGETSVDRSIVEAHFNNRSRGLSSE